MSRKADRMSPLFTWRSTICESGLSPTARHVALTLSLYMNERGGSAFPGGSRLARDTGLHLSTVKRAQAEIEKAGYLTVEKRGGSLLGGRRQATEYVAAFPLTGSRERPVAENDRYSCAPRPVAENALTGSTERPQDDSKATRKATKALVVYDDDFSEVWSHYPNKVDRGKALKAYSARRKAGAKQSDLLIATRNYATATAGTDPKFIKHGATFYGPDKPYEDFIGGIPKGAVSTGACSTNTQTIQRVGSVLAAIEQGALQR